MKDIKNEILDIIAKSLEVNSSKITLESTVDTIEEWDSLGHLSILVALDKRFNGKIAGISDMATVNSINSIFEILEDRDLI